MVVNLARSLFQRNALNTNRYNFHVLPVLFQQVTLIVCVYIEFCLCCVRPLSMLNYR